MSLATILLAGAGIISTGMLGFAAYRLTRLAERLSSAESLASQTLLANDALADMSARQSRAMERMRSYAKLLENKVLENGDVDDLASVLNELFNGSDTKGDNSSK